MTNRRPQGGSDEEKDRDLVCDFLHPTGSRRIELSSDDFDAVFEKGDGFGAGLSRHDLARINSGADWSHVRDSTRDAWRAMADELRRRGFTER